MLEDVLDLTVGVYRCHRPTEAIYVGGGALLGGLLEASIAARAAMHRGRPSLTARTSVTTARSAPFIGGPVN